ncbi:MAG: right-handed parallel beta-helix repeat-containing protein [Planctomycetota bacterium]|nr:right-handed parallel beta-helix repeat-containing protein [Planctomycetota bacterium]
MQIVSRDRYCPRGIFVSQVVGLTAAALVVLGLMAVSTESFAAKPLETVAQFGARGDGKTDDTAALQEAVDSRLGDILLPRGVYRITKPIVVEFDKVGFTSIRGSGAATIVMDGPGPAIKLIGTHRGTAAPHTVKPNIYLNERTPIVEGLEIVGRHEKALGIEAELTFQLIIDKVTIRDTLHAIRLATRNRNVIISNCHLYKNRGVGLYLDECDLHQINVVGSHISYNPGGGIVVRGGGVRNLHIGTCDIEGNVVNVLIDSAGSTGGTAEVAIVGCTIQHSGGPNSANIRFIGASPKGKDGSPGKRAWGHITIANNVLSDVETNIDIQKACEVSIVGNTIWKGYKYNLRVRDSSNVVVGPNIFARNKRYRSEETSDNAIVFENCDDMTLTGLHIHRVLRAPAGLVLDKCRRVNITGCSILDCDSLGILMKNVELARVSDCIIRNDRFRDGCKEAGDWRPMEVVGGKANMIVNNLLGKPASDKAVKTTDGSAVVRDNQIEP